MDNLLNEAIGLAAVMSPVILIFVQLIKTADLDKRWLPLISIVLGIAVGIVFAIAGNADLFLYGLAGFLSGAASSGLYDGIQSIRKGE
ncbi:Phage holin [Alkalibacterium subtropicum]|uniref:Phage holin n=1 Tax=Alkalibacterium subtropicum TaxID=753702 RepID=A0A1I1EV75_9LACT|nr:holin [Alkalibacterium subtropicum]SFB91045.1 Phage holin [Alkalibacterium subtropicum]